MCIPGQTRRPKPKTKDEFGDGDDDGPVLSEPKYRSGTNSFGDENSYISHLKFYYFSKGTNILPPRLCSSYC